MMYNKKLVVAVKVDGKVLREANDTVSLPFSSEYTLFIRNLATTDAVVNITIDGTDITPNGLVIRANSSLDLERPINNGNLTSGNKLKFVERSAAVEAHRGIGAEDGLIRVQYQFAKYIPPVTLNSSQGTWGSPTIGGNCNGGLTSRGISWGHSLNNVNGGYYSYEFPVDFYPSQSSTSSINSCSVMRSMNTAGITVAGSESHQSFITVPDVPMEDETHVIVLKLVGEVGGKPVPEPITVKHKPTCTTCGRVNKATSHYCNQCGTSLTIF